MRVPDQGALAAVGKAGSAAEAAGGGKQRAGPILKNERAEVRGLLQGWREENSALWFPEVRTQGIGLCTRYTATARRSSPHAPLTPWGTHPLYLGTCDRCVGPHHSKFALRTHQHEHRAALLVGVTDSSSQLTVGRS